MKILRSLGLMLLGGVLTLALMIGSGIHDESDAPNRAARAALTDIGLRGIMSEVPRAMTLDTHGGFHGDGCCLTRSSRWIPATGRPCGRRCLPCRAGMWRR